jgi:hypothetical protein
MKMMYRSDMPIPRSSPIDPRMGAVVASPELPGCFRLDDPRTIAVTPSGTLMQGKKKTMESGAYG